MQLKITPSINKQENHSKNGKIQPTDTNIDMRDMLKLSQRFLKSYENLLQRTSKLNSGQEDGAIRIPISSIPQQTDQFSNTSQAFCLCEKPETNRKPPAHHRRVENLLPKPVGRIGRPFHQKLCPRALPYDQKHIL